MTKVNFITTPLKNSNSVRGVGFYTKNLLIGLKKHASDFDIDIVEDGSGEIAHYPFFDLFYHTLPISKKTKTIVTIHDVVPLEFPQIYQPGIRGTVNFNLQKLSLLNVDRVITDSYASVKAIHKYLKIPHEKIKLVYLAPADHFKKLKNPKTNIKLPEKFILYTGGINWNKNLIGLVKAATLIKIPLVIAGKSALEIDNMDFSHSELAHLKELSALIKSSNVTRLGFVPDEDLVNVYNLASVYCQPSFAEGFGLPVLEALACGTPVACSKTYSLPEIGGDDVHYFDPYNIDSICAALKTAIKTGLPNPIKKFSWDQTAKQTLQVYQEIT